MCELGTVIGVLALIVASGVCLVAYACCVMAGELDDQDELRGVWGDAARPSAGQRPLDNYWQELGNQRLPQAPGPTAAPCDGDASPRSGCGPDGIREDGVRGRAGALPSGALEPLDAALRRLNSLSALVLVLLLPLGLGGCGVSLRANVAEAGAAAGVVAEEASSPAAVDRAQVLNYLLLRQLIGGEDVWNRRRDTRGCVIFRRQVVERYWCE